MNWSTDFIISRWCIESSFKLMVEVLISSWQCLVCWPWHSGLWNRWLWIWFGNDATVVRHCFVWWVSIWSTFQTLVNFPLIWTVLIRRCILEETFPVFCPDLVDSFTASIDPFLLEAILSTNFSSHMWNHPRLRFLARFWFPNVDCCSRDENVA